MLNILSDFMVSLTSCSGNVVEMNVTVVSSADEPAGGGVTVKYRSSKPPLVDGSEEAKHENSGEINGILKNRL
jgi:hypothetical protein